MSEDKPKILFIDDREPASFVNLVIETSTILIEMKHLETGDYVCEDVVIERKTIDDFVSSIIDKRVFRQCERMLKSPHRYLLISGRIKDIWSKITPHAVLGAIAFFVNNGISVVTLDDNEEMVYMILKILENHGKLVVEPSYFKKDCFKKPVKKKKFKRKRKVKPKDSNKFSLT